MKKTFLITSLLALALCLSCKRNFPPVIEKLIPWMGNGVWVQADALSQPSSEAISRTGFADLLAQFAPSAGEAAQEAVPQIWLYARDSSAAATADAVQAGAFFAVQGEFVREVIFTVSAAGLRRPVFAGEIAAIAPGTEVTIELNYEPLPSRPVDEVLLFAVSESGLRKLAGRAPAPGRIEFSEKITIPKDGITLCAGGRRQTAEGPAQWFYTNTIKILSKPRPKS